MNADLTSFGDLKREVIALCRRKGWGIDGVQHPQHIAMAMTVEVSEVLEHFIDMTPEFAARLVSGKEPGKLAEIAEEIADVMNYSLQILYSLGIDISAGFGGVSDESTPAADVVRSVGTGDKCAVSQAMIVSVTAAQVLEKFQFVTESEVTEMLSGGLIEIRRRIGLAFHDMYIELFKLVNLLGIDVSEQIRRKLAIVERRAVSADEPAR